MHPVCERGTERERQLYQQHSSTPNSSGDGIVIHQNIKALPSPHTPTQTRSTMENQKKKNENKNNRRKIAVDSLDHINRIYSLCLSSALLYALYTAITWCSL